MDDVELDDRDVRRLVVAILLCAVQDARCRHLKRAQEARSWLMGDEARKWAEMIDLDPDKIRRWTATLVLTPSLSRTRRNDVMNKT